jgi:PAS domain-containing protein
MRELPAEVHEPPVVICLIENGRVAYASETTTQVSGFPPERFRDRLVSELVHPDDHALISPFAEGWTGEFDVAIRLQDSDGRWTWRRVRGVRKIDEVGPFALVTLRKLDI